MPRETKFYNLLGVSPSADEDEIRRAYKRKAVQMHPDKGGDEDAFKELCHAYSVLSDSQKRAAYDRGGEAAVSDDGPGGGGMGGMADMMSAMFGGGMGGGGPRRQPKPRPIVHTIDVPLESFYRGKTIKLAIVRSRHCDSCKGSGSIRAGVSVKCSQCQGRGQRQVVQQIAPGLISQSTIPCGQCNGKGTDIAEADKCKTCRGKQVAEKRDVFEVRVDKGMGDGDRVVFPGDGDQVPGVDQAGDIVIQLKEKKHAVFERHGKYLLVKQTLSLADALCGFHFIIPHLDGRHLHVKNQPGQVVRPGQLYAIHQEGMPAKGSGGFDKGDLLVVVNVIMPDSVDEKTSAALRDVLGPMATKPMPRNGDFYETTMHETNISLEDLAGKDDDSDDDDERGGQTATCRPA